MTELNFMKKLNIEKMFPILTYYFELKQEIKCCRLLIKNYY